MMTTTIIMTSHPFELSSVVIAKDSDDDDGDGDRMLWYYSERLTCLIERLSVRPNVLQQRVK